MVLGSEIGPWIWGWVWVWFDIKYSWDFKLNSLIDIAPFNIGRSNLSFSLLHPLLISHHLQRREGAIY